MLGVGGRTGESCLFGETEHEIHRLNRLARRSLDEIVYCRNGHNPAGSIIREHGEVAIIGTLDIPRIGDDAFVNSDESFTFIEVAIQGTKVGEPHRIA